MTFNSVNETLTPEQLEKRELEAQRLCFEMFKHLCTLNSGAIVILLAVQEKLALAKHALWMVPIAIVLFLVSMLCSLGAMSWVEFTVRPNSSREFKNAGQKSNVPKAAAVLTFFFGLALIATFIIVNTWPFLLP